MAKIKVKSANRTQQKNVITKCRNWGAEARDGNYGPVSGKTAVVINTSLGGGMPALQLSRLDFTPTKKAYTQTIEYKDFMNLKSCPWGATFNGDSNTSAPVSAAPSVKTVIKEVQVPVLVEVPVATGVCAQQTMQVKSCDVLEQNSTIWSTVGLPALQDLGIEVTMADDVAYIIDVAKNSAKPLTAKSAAKKAKAAIEDNDTDSPWAVWARKMDLVDNAVMVKVIEDKEV